MQCGTCCKVVLTTILIFVGFSTKVTSQSASCDTTLKSIGGPHGYSTRISRCEGLYESPVSSSLTVVAVVRGNVNYRLERNRTIVVKAAEHQRYADFETHIRSVGRYAGTYYRMDCIIAPGDSLLWPVGEVLEPNGLGANKIGVYGWIDAPEGRLFVPVRVYEQNGSHQQGPIKILVRTDVKAEEIVWRHFVDDLPPTQWMALGKNVEAGDIISCELDEGDEAVIKVDLRVLDQHSDRWLPCPLRVLRNAR